MRHLYPVYAACLASALAVIGCDDEAASRAGPSSTSDPTPAADSPRQPAELGANEAASGAISPTAADVTIESVDYRGLLQFIEKNEGHPIVLDVWSTSCEPCIRALPDLTKLQEDYDDQGVVCATLSIDHTGAEGTTAEEAGERALEVLAALDVDVKNFFSTVPDRELLRQELFKENGVYAPPAILVIDRSGNVVGKFGEAAEDGSPYNDVRNTIDSLL